MFGCLVIQGPLEGRIHPQPVTIKVCKCLQPPLQKADTVDAVHIMTMRCQSVAKRWRASPVVCLRAFRRPLPAPGCTESAPAHPPLLPSSGTACVSVANSGHSVKHSRISEPFHEGSSARGHAFHKSTVIFTPRVLYPSLRHHMPATSSSMLSIIS